MKSRDDGQIFDDDTLWEELNGADGGRRQAALQTLDAVGELAALRAAADSNLSFNDAWQEVFDWDLLRVDLEEDGNREIHEAAWRMWEAVMHLSALRDVADGELTGDDKRWAKELAAKVRKRLNDMRLAAGYAVAMAEGAHG